MEDSGVTAFAVLDAVFSWRSTSLVEDQQCPWYEGPQKLDTMETFVEGIPEKSCVIRLCRAGRKVKNGWRDGTQCTQGPREDFKKGLLDIVKLVVAHLKKTKKEPKGGRWKGTKGTAARRLVCKAKTGYTQSGTQR